MNEVVRTATQRGRALLDLGRAKEAEKHIREALAAEPDSAPLLTLLAEALLEQDQHEAAEDTSRSALASDPELVPAYSVRTAALIGLKRFPEALTAVRRGLALAPEAAGLHLQEAGVLVAQELYQDALASVERATALDPANSTAATVRAAVLCQLARYDEADAAVDEALRLDPENAEAHRIRGVIALHRGGGRSAVRAHRAALRLDPTDVHSRDGLSLALKTRNPLYGWLLRFSLWLDSLPKVARIAVLVAPLVLTRVLRPAEDQLWAQVLIIVVAALALLSWTLEPLMNCVLLLGRDRNLLSRDAKLATYTFAAFLAAAVACAVYGQINGPGQLMAIAFGFGLWAMATGSTHLLEEGPKKLVRFGAVAAVVIGGMAIAAVLAGASGASGATVAVALLFLGAVVSLWVGAFSK
ncbi:tetratricopeptide repeat protein [Actinophytocola sp.]|uniref:tetratricopeptide repeat protein n=1 Tax=Actinophytocola sp. TaxID=1872138 RepID=UPI002ED1AA43